MTENPVDDLFWGEVDSAAERADAGGFRYGLLTIKPHRYIHWIDSEPNDVTPQEFSKLPAEDKSLELMFSIDVQGINPDLEWGPYERRLRPGDIDWKKILKPSIVAIMGPDSMKKGNYASTLQALSGRYVEVADVPQTKNDEYNTLKFVRLFETKEECFNAYKERFKDGDSGVGVPTSAPLSHPESYTAESWAAMVPSIKTALATSDPMTVAEQYKVDVSFIAAIAAQG